MQWDIEEQAMFREEPLVMEALSSRTKNLAHFWFSNPHARKQPIPILTGKNILMIDAEDTFTNMLAQQLLAIGLHVTIRRNDEPGLLAGKWDLVVMGPGPGDPCNMNDNRIARMRIAVSNLYNEGSKFLAICLSHQMLCLELGFDLVRREVPNQGVQKEINFFGKSEYVGFYNTYVAKGNNNLFEKMNKLSVEVCYDEATSEIHALRSKRFASFQFHPESILTQYGINIICTCLKDIII